MDLSRLNYKRLAVGLTAAALLVISVLFLPWFSLTETPARDVNQPEQFNADAFICGDGEFECTGWETFPILRWLLLLTALAPIILAYILVRAHKTSYPPGEITMTAGFAATVLIAYNGIIDRPGSTVAETGNGLEYGYWIALLAALAIGIVGYTRSLESGGKAERKPPGTF